MTHDALFGQLRSILQRPASRETWVELCDHLDLWPTDRLEQLGLPYALDIVSRWSADVARKAPHRWVNRLVAGRDVTLLSLTTSLELYTYLGSPEQHAAMIAASPHLQNPRELNLSSNAARDAGAASLAASPYFKGLISLDLSHNKIGPKGAAALAASTNLTNLAALDLNNKIGDAGAAALAASPHLPEPVRAQWR